MNWIIPEIKELRVEQTHSQLSLFQHQYNINIASSLENILPQTDKKYFIPTVFSSCGLKPAFVTQIPGKTDLLIKYKHICDIYQYLPIH